jgi:hypothetical protein
MSKLGQEFHIPQQEKNGHVNMSETLELWVIAEGIRLCSVLKMSSTRFNACPNTHRRGSQHLFKDLGIVAYSSSFTQRVMVMLCCQWEVHTRGVLGVTMGKNAKATYSSVTIGVVENI